MFFTERSISTLPGQPRHFVFPFLIQGHRKIAHTDQRGLMEWYGAIAGHPPLALVHGEDKAREALAGEIGERYGVQATLVRPGMVMEV